MSHAPDRSTEVRIVSLASLPATPAAPVRVLTVKMPADLYAGLEEQAVENRVTLQRLAIDRLRAAIPVCELRPDRTELLARAAKMREEINRIDRENS